MTCLQIHATDHKKSVRTVHKATQNLDTSNTSNINPPQKASLTKLKLQCHVINYAENKFNRFSFQTYGI